MLYLTGFDNLKKPDFSEVEYSSLYFRYADPSSYEWVETELENLDQRLFSRESIF